MGILDSIRTTERKPAPADQAERWIELTPRSGWRPLIDFRELWEYRRIAATLAVRDLRASYKQTMLGVLWIVLAPLGSVVVYTFVFDKIAGLPSQGIPYPVFVFSGLLLWNFHSGYVTNAVNSLVSADELVERIYFPRLLVPIAAMLPRLIDLAVGAVVMVVLMAVYGVTPGLAVALTPLWIVGMGAFSTAVGAGLAALNVRYRDVGQLVTYVLSVWLFLSPVVYASDQLTGATRILLSLNPVTGLIDGLRWSLLDAPSPPPSDLLGLAVGLLGVGGSLVYFAREQRNFADLI